MRIATFTQTPFVSHDDKNIVYLRVEDWDMCNPYEIQLFLDGQLYNTSLLLYYIKGVR